MLSGAHSLKNVEIHQGHLEEVVQELFGSENVIRNSRKKSQIVNPNTGHFLEIDVWIPNIHLGFEFQDNYHYSNAGTATWYTRLSRDEVQQKDSSKRDSLKEAEITLIEVPCWWDGTPESLVATIRFERPDLLLNQVSVSPISFNPSPSFFPKEELPSVGILMLASFPGDRNFNHSVVSNTWWMGEKYDGVRCCWNPDQNTVYSRTGRQIPLPDNIKAALPKISIDGECWFGRGMFSLIYNMLYGESSWPGLRMMSFDFPHQSFHQFPFEYRYAILLNFIADHPINIVAQRVLCEDAVQLNSLVGKIIDCGGEGMILRRVGSRYEQGRNNNLIKLKTSYGDTEGLVVALDAVAVSLKLPNGQIFKVPMQNVHILSPPLQIDEVVTFSYEKLARRDVPVNAEIFRRRSDLKWEDVLTNSKSHIQESGLRSDTFTSQPRGFWSLSNMREYMINLAKKLNFDPLLPSTWSKIPLKLINETKGGRIILAKFKDSFTALVSLFPDIGLQNKLRKKVRNIWASPTKRRQFFEKYARDNGFDYLSPEAWYLQPNRKILAVKGAAAVVSYHKNDVWRALTDLFPDIGLSKTKSTVKKWQKRKHRRAFFENYAREKGFDFRDPEAWYTQSRSKILSLEGARDIAKFHKGISNALIELFPEIGLEKSRFNSATWISPAQRRLFFENYAAENKFDYLSPEAWYAQPNEKILATKGAQGVLSYYNGSISKALMELFPNIGLEQSGFLGKKWKSKKNRRAFFEKYAVSNGFSYLDPTAWFSQTTRKILSYKGAKGVLHYYKQNLSKALEDLFPEMGLEKKSKWNSKKNRRAFFENYAKENGFDSLSPTAWYSQSRSKIYSLDGAYGVVRHHKNLTTALIELFPEIGLEKSKFTYARYTSHNEA